MVQNEGDQYLLYRNHSPSRVMSYDYGYLAYIRGNRAMGMSARPVTGIIFIKSARLPEACRMFLCSPDAS